MLEVLLGRDDTDAAKLIELLKSLLGKIDKNQVKYKDAVAKLQTTITRMLENDPYSELSVVSKTGLYKTGHFGNLIDEDKRMLENNKVVDKDAAKALDLENIGPFKPNMEIELKDSFKASKISFKFVAFRTAN